MNPSDAAGRFWRSRFGGGRLAIGGALRVAFVLFGGIVALQSSPALDLTKIAYLVGGIVCLVGAMASLWVRRNSPVVRLAAPWLGVSAGLVVLLALSFGVARANGTPAIDWLRDVAAYALFATAPLFALDAHASMPRRMIVGILVVLGVVGGLSWAVEWLGRRDILELSIARLLFPSGQLPAMLYVFAMAAALMHGRRPAVWLVLAGATLGLFLVTGTRSSLLLLSAPLAMAILAGWEQRRSSTIALVSHGVIAAAVVVLFQLVQAQPPVEPTEADPARPAPAGTPASDIVGDRLGSLPGIVENPGSDASVRERVAQYRAAWELFASSPVLGVGPGHAIEWTNVSGQDESGFVADTPLVMPAKFGLVGVAVFIAAGVAYWHTLRATLSRSRRSVVTLALAGYGAWVVVSLPLGFLIEDKGASLALIPLLALAYGDPLEPAGSR